MKKPLPSIQELETQKRHVFEKLVAVEYEKLGLEYDKLDKQLVSIEYEKLERARRQQFAASGGTARARNLTAKQRKASARKAARARWGKKGKR
jgi:hypothetical protein